MSGRINWRVALLLVLAGLLAASFSLNLIQGFWILKLRKSQPQFQPVNQGQAASLPPGAFSELSEDSIPGRYKWIEDGAQKGEVVLFADHSASNWRTGKKSGYRWELQRDGLVVVWLKGFNFFPRIAGRGVYEGTRDGHLVRMEKQEEGRP
jgi:hypothetical protein